mmetsp:Transcript_9177/g.14942  ORF Transcript_9177/g.14942 Transcript_9177/m.14942 type:complete len:334 (-) Transcript_9177:370-1371(-)
MTLTIDLQKVSVCNQSCSSPSGRYQLRRQLGSGREGEVWVAYDVHSGQEYAAKVSRVCDSESALRCKEIWGSLRHEGVLELVDVEYDDDSAFMITPICEMDLFELISSTEDGKLSEEDARRYFCEVVDAVDYLHSSGITHGDLKPENILLHRGSIKLCDFGSADFITTQKDWQSQGTEAYLPPEHYLLSTSCPAHKLKTARDAWALGIVLFAMVTGCLPWAEANLEDPAFAQFMRTGSLQMLAPTVPLSSDLESLLRKLLQPNPLQRLNVQSILSEVWCLEEEEDTFYEEPAPSSAFLVCRKRERALSSIIIVEDEGCSPRNKKMLVQRDFFC